MQNLINEAPKVAEAFFDMTAAIRASSALEPKLNELILIGIFTANQSLKGIRTHVTRAVQNGATQKEIISAIFLALPVCGIGRVNLALDEAMTALKECQTEGINQ